MEFFKSLERNNRREWFQPRKQIYDEQVKAPMAELIRALTAEMMRFAPDYVTEPEKAIYRIYRDTRFSADKRPLKTHAAASFPTRGLPRHQGAGLYFEIATEWVWIGGGMWAPEPPLLLRVREHIADTWPELHDTVRKRSFKQLFGDLGGETLARVPRGFSSQHPAAEYLKHYRFVAGREFPAAFAHSRAFYPTLVATFKALMPLVRFLNEPLTEDGQA